MPSAPMQKTKAPEYKSATLAVSVRPSFLEAFRRDAAARGLSASVYAHQLLEAAWSARHGKSGDRDLDQVVAGTLLLHGSGLDLDAIGKVLGASEDTVDKIVGAWMKEAA